jgi:hypothetical protein
MGIQEIGENINEAGREFKTWFTDFTLVYSPIFIVFGLILTGVDLLLNLGMGNSLWFKIPWTLAQLFAVDGIWFAIWNRILTDEYRWKYFFYHAFLILFGIAMTLIAITMNYIIFTQDYLGLKDGAAAMNFIGIPVSWFLLIRSILLMLTATLAIVLDKVMRTKRQYRVSTSKKSSYVPHVPEPHTTVVPADKPAPVLMIASPKPNGYREKIRSTMEKYRAEGRIYTYQDIANEIGCKLQTVKVHAPRVRREINEANNDNGTH